MAVATMRVPTVFTAVDRFSDVVSKMTRKTTAFGKVGSSAISRMDHRLNNMWGSMNNISQLAIGGGVGGLFYYAGKDVKDYETKIASLAAVTGTKIGAMNSQIEDLGKRTKMSVIDIAGAFEIVGSKMSEYLDNPEALKQITESAIVMSRAARMPLEESIDNLTQSLNIYKAEAKDAMHFVNKLSAGETVGSISIAQSTDILRQFGAQAVSTNVKLEESVALIQTLTKPLGIAKVGTGLRNILFDISAPATWDKNKLRAIKMAGINTKILTDETLSFRDRLKELEKFKGNNDAIGLFFKRTGTVVAKTLLQNIDVYDEFIKKIIKLDDAEDKAGKNTSTLSSLIDQMKASFTNFVVTGDNATGVLRIVKGLMGWMIDNMGNLVNLIVSVTTAFIGWKAIVGIVQLTAFATATYSRVLKFHALVTRFATMRNLSYAASLRAVAFAKLASLGPMALVVGALGLLAYSMWDTKSATDAMVGGQISALDTSNLAWKNSTNVVGSELEKQQRLINGFNTKQVASKEASKMNKILEEEGKRQKFANAISFGKDMSGNKVVKPLNNLIAKKLFENQQMEAVLGKDKATTLRNKGFSFEEFKKVYPNAENYNKKEKGEITVIFKGDTQSIIGFSANGDYDVKPQGINVITKPNQGQQ
jgi:TP901 family phage tail tape measure protein